jgi:hypothetical protein
MAQGTIQGKDISLKFLEKVERTPFIAYYYG